MTDRYTDNMSRYESETIRLNQQFDLFNQNIGYLLHPSITAALPATPRIADIATGTGVFLLKVREFYPDAILDGSDISSALFPPQSELPPNVTLTEQDVKKPLPEELHGKYDLVHVRLIVAGMLPDEWSSVVKNLTKLLKPGGFIQWEEGDFISLRYYRGHVDAPGDTIRTLGGKFVGALRERFQYGWNTLPGQMREAGLDPVISDVVSSDRVPETREGLTLASIRGSFNWARWMIERKTPDAMPIEEVEQLEKKAYEELKTGCYVRFDIHVAVGRKPLE
ncbi:hypothetical protein M426DRAFT_8979 [Hypoxylon sp. CI-4A]|nr:hypothetical protein M426DRAFT_8979 [Hypoxylon sp. CI-4A]